MPTTMLSTLTSRNREYVQNNSGVGADNHNTNDLTKGKHHRTPRQSRPCRVYNSG